LSRTRPGPVDKKSADDPAGNVGAIDARDAPAAGEGQSFAARMVSSSETISFWKAGPSRYPSANFPLVAKSRQI